MEMKHQNCCAFVGACIDPGRILLLWEYCHKGSLQVKLLYHNFIRYIEVLILQMNYSEWFTSFLIYCWYFAFHPKHLILQDVIWNQNIKLDRMFMFALSQDIAKVIRGNKIILIHVDNIMSIISHKKDPYIEVYFLRMFLFFI